MKAVPRSASMMAAIITMDVFITTVDTRHILKDSSGKRNGTTYATSIIKCSKKTGKSGSESIASLAQ